jgi:hypothetical protein
MFGRIDRQDTRKKRRINMKYVFIIIISLVSLILFFSSELFSPNPDMEVKKMKTTENKHLEVATFAGGCFWCTGKYSG